MSPNEALQNFASQVREKTLAVNSAKGKDAEQLNMELSMFIGTQMPKIMAEGVSVQEIQDALQAATDFVEQTYAPDAVESVEEHSEMLEPPISETTYFAPLDEEVIADFAAGELEPTELMLQICGQPDFAAFEDLTGVELVLTDFGKSSELEEASYGGEVIANKDGEAFMPEYLAFSNKDGGGICLCEPMVFKTAEEVAEICKILEPFSEGVFKKQANIKKLVKAEWVDKLTAKKEADYIVGDLWGDFRRLSEVYKSAWAQNKGVAIFVGYEGTITEEVTGESWDCDYDNIWEIKDKNTLLLAANNWLCKKCSYGDDIEKLTASERTFYINMQLEAEVDNGGFSQFFFNSGGNFSNEIVSSMREIGAETTAKICEKAISVFGCEIPADRVKRQEMLENSTEDIERTLHDCDDEFYKCQDNLLELNYQFVMKNREQFAKPSVWL